MRNDLHGSAPDKCPLALLLIDVINDLEYPEADRIEQSALEMAHRLSDLVRRARAHRVPIIYVNDNFGRWRSDFSAQVRHCLEDGVRGEQMVRLLQPEHDDYFILKPKHSGFFTTTLDLLLRHLGSQTLLLTGIAGNICVLFTANDAYMRDYRLVIPGDCTVSNDPRDNAAALDQMRRFLKADTRPSRECDLEGLMRTA